MYVLAVTYTFPSCQYYSLSCSQILCPSCFKFAINDLQIA